MSSLALAFLLLATAAKTDPPGTVVLTIAAGQSAQVPYGSAVCDDPSVATADLLPDGHARLRGIRPGTTLCSAAAEVFGVVYRVHVLAPWSPDAGAEERQAYRVDLPRFSITVSDDVLICPPSREENGSALSVVLQDGSVVTVARFLRHRSIPPGALTMTRTASQLDGLPATDHVFEWADGDLAPASCSYAQPQASRQPPGWADAVCLKRETVSGERAYWLLECSKSKKVAALREDFARVRLDIHDR